MFREARPAVGNVDPRLRKQRFFLRNNNEPVAGMQNNKIIVKDHFAREQRKY
jgi:hypothetical protein